LIPALAVAYMVNAAWGGFPFGLLIQSSAARAGVAEIVVRATPAREHVKTA